MRDAIDKAPVNDEELTLREVIYKFIRAAHYLRSKWFIIVFAVIVGLIAGLIYSLRQKPLYEAQVTFALQDNQSQGGAGTYSGLAAQLGLDLGTTSGSGPFAGSNVLELMQSRYVIEKTLLSGVNYKGKQTTLAEIYIKNNHLSDHWDSDPKLKSVRFLPDANQDTFTLEQDSILKSIYQNLTKNYISIDKVENATSIISISVKSNDQLFAKLLAETLVKDVSDYYIETKTQKTVENIAILQHQTDSVRRQLNLAIQGVAASNDINPNANPNMQILHTGAQRRAFDVQVNQTMLAELIRNLEAAKVTLRKETPLIQIIDRPRLPLDVKVFSKIKGVFIGAFAAFFISVVLLLMVRFLKSVME